jgi:hypothetical protein
MVQMVRVFLGIKNIVFKDFIVGAPYDGVNKRGAIYVYHGQKGGIHEEYSQVIYAEDVAPVRFFSQKTRLFEFFNNRTCSHLAGRSRRARILTRTAIQTWAWARTRAAMQLC